MRKKLPVHGLFYFESDQTVSIVPLKKIVSVLSGDKTTKGSKVELVYGTAKVSAEVIAVADDLPSLREREIEFLQDPGNAHLFTNHDAIVFTGDNPEEAEENPPLKMKIVSHRIGKKRRGRSKMQVVDTPESPSSPSDTPVSPVLNASTQHCPTVPNKPLPSFLPALQSSMFHSLQSLPRSDAGILQQILPILGRLEYKIDILMNKVGIDKSFTEASQYSCSQLITTPKIQQTVVETDTFHSAAVTNTSAPSSRLPEVPRAVTTLKSRKVAAEAAALHSAALNNAPPLFSQLPEVPSTIAVNGKDLDVVPTPDKTEPSKDPEGETVKEWDGSEEEEGASQVPDEQCITTPLKQCPTSEQAPAATPHHQQSTQSITPAEEETYQTIFRQANSMANFSVRLMRHLFKRSEMCGRNVRGARGKKPLDPERVKQIKFLIYRFYSVPPADMPRFWTHCRKSMDSFLRKMKENPSPFEDSSLPT
ncbi:uncharacterized protein LOC116621573 isoform X2 [Nematostella vectensis]|uniref:uncharacterized protein LOC116621573 isoform X2 n=1 Tax=Nematostella vectensis TaxID=45351 RepID=UPI002076FCC8|nr:uncharacterized protein LOC116621573 isoform X2 [Nematostella vectensis]